MIKSRFLNISLAVTIGVVLFLSLGMAANAQYLPISYYYTSPLAFPTNVYINTIDGYLLGFNTSNFILPVYPTFTYGDPAIYALWLSLNP